MMPGYMDEDEPDPGRSRRLIARVRSQCVEVDPSIKPMDLKDLVIWCRENIGEPRPHHPIFEAEDGWMDYFEGCWAVDYLVNHDGRDVHSFWFEYDRDRTLFKLTWL